MLRNSHRGGQPIKHGRSGFDINDLTALFRNWGGFEAGVDRNVFGRFDSKTDTISTDFQNRDLDVVGKNNLLVFLTTDDNIQKTANRKKEVFSFMVSNPVRWLEEVLK